MDTIDGGTDDDAGRGRGRGGKLPNMSPGEWLCPKEACGNVNFARRSECNRCNAAKPPPENLALKFGGALPIEEGGMGGDFEGIGAGRGRGRGRGGRPPNPGDWLCPNEVCGNVNFARRSECNKCNTAAPPGVGGKYLAFGGKKRDAGDWDCPSCGNVNYARRDTCNLCNDKKPGTAERIECIYNIHI